MRLLVGLGRKNKKQKEIDNYHCHLLASLFETAGKDLQPHAESEKKVTGRSRRQAKKTRLTSPPYFKVFLAWLFGCWQPGTTHLPLAPPPPLHSLMWVSRQPGPTDCSPFTTCPISLIALCTTLWVVHQCTWYSASLRLITLGRCFLSSLSPSLALSLWKEKEKARKKLCNMWLKWPWQALFKHCLSSELSKKKKSSTKCHKKVYICYPPMSDQLFFHSMEREEVS